jgi:hypothetical protein
VDAPFIAANVIIGSRPEPFFPMCLESVEKGIDYLVLNDNSGNPNNPNLKAFYESKLYKDGRTALLQTDLKKLTGFDEARNLCIEETIKRFPNQDLWILYLDTDEVHTPRFASLTRRFLPSLPPSVGVVDGYFYQFIQSFDYYSSLDRRHNLLFRYKPGIHWEKPIHSELRGITGKRVPTGYVYFHYGYVFAPENVLRRWKLYKAYDSIPFDPDKLQESSLFYGYEKNLVRFLKDHPHVMERYIQEKKGEGHVQQYTEYVSRYFAAHPGHRLKARVREVNWKLRLAFRNFQAALATAPHLISNRGRSWLQSSR